MNPNVITSLNSLLGEANLDILIFMGLPNIRYLAGFTGTDGVLCYSRQESVFLTDSRYMTQAREQVTVDRVECYKSKFSGIVDQLKSWQVGRVGFDAEIVTVAVLEELKKLAPSELEWVPLTDQLRPLRACKTESELTLLRHAASLNQQAFQKIIPLIQPGVMEREIALELEFALKRLGGEANAFDFIVASGSRGALPHGVASDKVLQAGELITIDFGTRVNGYHSDETVTLALGEVTGKLRQIFDIVLKAHDLALEAVEPGMKISDLDAVARDHISAKGFGDFFGHGLGHGVGLEIHEYPAVSPRTDDLLLEGMVITIEPGIYLPGTGGVRIEDTVVVTAGGCQLLTQIPKQFLALDA